MGFWSAFLVFAAVIGAISGIVEILEYFGVKPPETKMRGFLKSNGVVIICMLLTWLGVAVDWHMRSVSPANDFSQWETYPLKQVRGKHFEAETVKLDGVEYINCVFDNVTFEYEGTAPTRLTASQIIMPPLGTRMVGMTSSHPIVTQTQAIIFGFSAMAGVLPNGTCVDDKPIK